MKRGLGPLLAVAGGVIVAAAVGWWWATYQDVIRYAYISSREAGYCLVGETDICALARALCRGTHPVALINYSSLSLWAGLLVLSAGLIVGGWQKVPRSDTRPTPDDLWF